MRKKINMQFMIVAAVAIVITAVSSMLFFYTIFKKQVFEDLKAYAHMVCSLEGPEQPEDYEYHPESDDLRITLVDSNGTVLFDSLADEEGMDNHMNRPEIRQALEKGEGTAIRKSDTIAEHTLYYAMKLSDGNILRIGKTSDSIYHIWRNTIFLVVILSVIILGVCVFLSHFLTKRLLIPIEKMATNLDGISQDNTYSEMQPFVRTIKEQHINILNSAKMRQEFTANVSHELKTPLTAISGYAELIGSGMADTKDTVRFANEIYQNSNRLLTLINDIIKLSELDDNDQIFEMEQVDLYQAAQNCINMMEVQARKQDVTLRLEGESCIITANKNLMEELLYNLCSNAIRYNNRGGSVTISVRHDGRKVLLSVKDTGIGIPREHQERVFERFYRVDKSRSKQSGGTGLGLAIVKHIVAQHNAEMTLESEVGKGTEIRILF